MKCNMLKMLIFIIGLQNGEDSVLFTVLEGSSCETTIKGLLESQAET